MAACCSQTGVGGHAEQDPVGTPELPDLPDSLAWRAPSSGQQQYTVKVISSLLKKYDVRVFFLAHPYYLAGSVFSGIENLFAQIQTKTKRFINENRDVTVQPVLEHTHAPKQVGKKDSNLGLSKLTC